jgi:hypothetical protein
MDWRNNKELKCIETYDIIESASQDVYGLKAKFVFTVGFDPDYTVKFQVCGHVLLKEKELIITKRMY